MKLFVTGGTGFIGSHFLNLALDEGHEVIALRRSPQSNPRILLEKDPVWLEKEMPEVTALDLEGCEVFVHLAAYGVGEGMSDWENCFRVNVIESLHLWRLAASTGIKRFVICGSCFEYGRSGERYEFIPVDAPLEPTGAYHSSKASATMAALGLAVDQDLAMTILRPFHVFGEGEAVQRFWPSLREAALSGADFPMSSGKQVRDFVHVSEVASRFLEAMEFRTPYQTPRLKNLGSGRPQTLLNFAQYWWQQWNARGELQIGVLPLRQNEVMRIVPRL